MKYRKDLIMTVRGKNAVRKKDTGIAKQSSEAKKYFSFEGKAVELKYNLFYCFYL